MNTAQDRLLRLRNRMASSTLYTRLRAGLRSYPGRRVAWQKNRVDTADKLLASRGDAHWVAARGGRQKWSACEPTCLNRRPVKLPWWWYRDLHWPDLELIALNDALAYREDALSAQAQASASATDPWAPMYGYVWTSDGLAVDESFRATSPSPRLDEGQLARIRRTAKRIEGTYYYLGWLSKHYGHFLLESLARLWPLLAPERAAGGWGLAAFPMEHNRLEEGKTGQIPGFFTHAFGHFDIDLSRVRLIREPVLFERLLLPTPSFQMAGESYCAPLQAGVWASIQGDDWRGADRAVYLSRSKYKLWNRVRRPLGNEAEVEALFRQHGFDIVYPETLSFEEQLTLLGRCAVLAGPVGSNMHNSAFMQADTMVLILAPTGFVPLTDYLINAPKGIRTHYFLTPTEVMAHDSEQPWEVDLVELEKALTKAQYAAPVP